MFSLIQHFYRHCLNRFEVLYILMVLISIYVGSDSIVCYLLIIVYNSVNTLQPQYNTPHNAFKVFQYNMTMSWLPN